MERTDFLDKMKIKYETGTGQLEISDFKANIANGTVSAVGGVLTNIYTAGLKNWIQVGLTIANGYTAEFYSPGKLLPGTYNYEVILAYTNQKFLGIEYQLKIFIAIQTDPQGKETKFNSLYSH